MPFDAMTSTASVLDRLGLIPVSNDVLVDYKRDTLERFRAMVDELPRFMRHLYADARWIEFVQRDTKFFHGPLDMADGTVYRAWNYGMTPLLAIEINTRSTTPDAVKTIVEEVQRRAEAANIDTEQVAGFFYADPYVCLAYRENDTVKTACLAIWDGQTVLYKATLT